MPRKSTAAANAEAARPEVSSSDYDGALVDPAGQEIPEERPARRGKQSMDRRDGRVEDRLRDESATGTIEDAPPEEVDEYDWMGAPRGEPETDESQGDVDPEESTDDSTQLAQSESWIDSRPDLVTHAGYFGITPEQAAEYQTPYHLEAVLRRLAAREYGNNGQQDGDGRTAAEAKTNGRKRPAIELKTSKEKGYDEAMASDLQSLQRYVDEYVDYALTGLRDEVSSTLQERDQRWTQQELRREAHRMEMDFNSSVRELSTEYKDVLGDQPWQAAPNSAARKAYDSLLKQYAVLWKGYRETPGVILPPTRKLVENAAMMLWGERKTEKQRAKLRDDLNRRAGQATARPSGRSTEKSGTGDAAAVRVAREGLARIRGQRSR